MKINLILFVLFFSNFSHGLSKTIEDRRASLRPYFTKATEKYFVPRKVLESISYVETRFSNEVTKFETHSTQPSYGVMGIKKDGFLQYSLREASQLLRVEEKKIQNSPEKNIEAVAVLLSQMAHEKTRQEGKDLLKLPLLTWFELSSTLSGFLEPSSRKDYMTQLFQAVSDLYPEEKKALEESELKNTFQIFNQPSVVRSEIPGVDWDPSPNFQKGPYKKLFIVVHTTQGSFSGAVSWLKNPRSKVSAHFVVRSRDGYIKQLVDTSDRAWHARCWNSLSIGIEQEAWKEDESWFTDEMYASVAQLVKNLSDRYAIPMESTYIVGHNYGDSPRDALSDSPVGTVGDCNDHTDPGPLFNWKKLFSLLWEYSGFQSKELTRHLLQP